MIYMTYLKFASFPLGKDDLGSIELRSYELLSSDGSYRKDLLF